MHTIQAPGKIAEWEDTKKSNLFLVLLSLLMAGSFFVWVEPAPYDLFILFLCIGSLLMVPLTFPSRAMVPAFFLFIFMNSNLFSGLFIQQETGRSLFYLSISMYLYATWLFFASVIHTFQERAMTAIFKGYLVAAVIAASVGIAAFFSLLPQSDLFLQYGRINSFFKDPNVFGPFLIPVSLYAWHLVETTPKTINRIGSFLLFGLLAIGIMLSMSRAAWGNFVISLFLYLFLPFSGGTVMRWRNIWLLLLLSLPLLLYFLQQPHIYEQMEMRFKLQGYDADRFGTQLLSLSSAVESPFGIGPGQAEIVFAYSTHSLYVRTLIEYGLLGVVSLLLFLGCILFQAFRHAWSKQSPMQPFAAIIAASLVGLLFNSFFIDTLHWRHFWLLLALPLFSQKGE